VSFVVRSLFRKKHIAAQRAQRQKILILSLHCNISNSRQCGKPVFCGRCMRQGVAGCG
jgi:hypothetical protein